MILETEVGVEKAKKRFNSFNIANLFKASVLVRGERAGVSHLAQCCLDKVQQKSKAELITVWGQRGSKTTMCPHKPKNTKNTFIF